MMSARSSSRSTRCRRNSWRSSGWLTSRYAHRDSPPAGGEK
jgi:hypothetical protein